MTRARIKAHLWLNNSPIPQEICIREPALNDYGFYRRLDSGKLEFVSFCEKKANEFFAMYKDDFERLMKEANGQNVSN